MKQVKFRIPQRAFAFVIGMMLSVCAMAQITVNGHVKDSTGEDVIGATVRVIGDQGGSVTDFEGKFTLKCKQGADLQVSYVGYKTKTVKAASQLEIILEDDSEVLENVVVIGYGVAKK
ncbi:MAG: carboxypeptidase-like regulatory domain-containing protein, partial [Prevotella sp.]|nr:carboxypeptidase-like regulatory domain-containing protein [Prevotella sp.]